MAKVLPMRTAKPDTLSKDKGACAGPSRKPSGRRPARRPAVGRSLTRGRR